MHRFAVRNNTAKPSHGLLQNPLFATDTVPRYCLRCNEQLFGSGPQRCPICRLQYDIINPATYRSERAISRWKFWFPGFCLAVVSGVVSYAVCRQSGDLGLALFAAVPVSVGAILGYATRGGFWLLALLGLAATGGVVCMLLSLNLAGFFCGMTLAIIFLLPVFVGICLGLILRYFLKRTSWDQRWYLPIVLFMSLPYGVQAVGNFLPRRTEIATVKTELSVHATPREAWNAVMFYEEVEHDPPWLLRLALPKPVRSVGGKQHVGQIVRCYYDRGYLVKRISRRREGRLLAFEVIEQKLHFERDVTLLDGSFQIEPAGEGSSRIVLTTRYQRHLHPCWLWRPIEQRVVHTLHAHVLEGMRRHTRDLQDNRHHGTEETYPYPDQPDSEPILAFGNHKPPRQRTLVSPMSITTDTKGADTL